MPHMVIGDNFEILTHLPQLGHGGVVASDSIGSGTCAATTYLKHLTNDEVYVVIPRVWFNVENLVHKDEVGWRVEWVLEYH
jgi:hypothetical protein